MGNLRTWLYSGGLVVGLLAWTGGMALAGTATATLTVTATALKNCTISTSPIAFGNYDPVGANATTPLDQTGSITITCTKGTTTTIGLDTGQNPTHATGTTRAMASGSEYLSYDIYQDAAHTTLWGNASGSWFTPAAAPSKAPRSFTAYGRVPGGQDVTAGNAFTDTLIATVTF